ncbi:hypothetical protein D3C78_1660530 [compost metagenome]
MHIGHRQRSRALKPLEHRAAQLVQRRFVDPLQALYRLFRAVLGLHRDRPGLKHLMVGQRLAKALGQFPILFDLVEKAQHILNGLRRLAFGVENGFAFRFRHQLAVGVKA